MDQPKTLFIVRSKEQPRIGHLCSEGRVQHWVEIILVRGETPDVQEVTVDELRAIIPPNPKRFLFN